MHFRHWIVRLCLVLGAACPTFAVERGAAFETDLGRHITINAPAGTAAGSICCVFVSAPGQGQVTVEAELAGKSLPVHLIAVGDAGYIACFYVPSGSSGETVDVTASSGSSSSSATVPVF
jgi:hypothetical protein